MEELAGWRDTPKAGGIRTQPRRDTNPSPRLEGYEPNPQGWRDTNPSWTAQQPTKAGGIRTQAISQDWRDTNPNHQPRLEGPPADRIFCLLGDLPNVRSISKMIVFKSRKFVGT